MSHRRGEEVVARRNDVRFDPLVVLRKTLRREVGHLSSPTVRFTMGEIRRGSGNGSGAMGAAARGGDGQQGLRPEDLTGRSRRRLFDPSQSEGTHGENSTSVFPIQLPFTGQRVAAPRHLRFVEPPNAWFRRGTSPQKKCGRAYRRTFRSCSIHRRRIKGM